MEALCYLLRFLVRAPLTIFFFLFNPNRATCDTHPLTYENHANNENVIRFFVIV